MAVSVTTFLGVEDYDLNFVLPPLLPWFPAGLNIASAYAHNFPFLFRMGYDAANPPGCSLVGVQNYNGNRMAIGFPIVEWFTVETDFNVTGLEYLDIFLNFALWAEDKQVLQEVAPQVKYPCWTRTVQAGDTTGVFFPMAYTPQGTNTTNLKNNFRGNCFMRLISLSPTLRFEVAFFFILHHDYYNYLAPGATDNISRLLRGGKDEPILDNTTGITVYNDTKYIKTAIWFYENPANTDPQSVYRRQLGPIRHRFYDRDALDQPQTVIDSWEFRFYANTNQVTSISTVFDTELAFRFTTSFNPSAVANWQGVFLVIEETNDFAETYLQSYRADMSITSAPLTDSILEFIFGLDFKSLIQQPTSFALTNISGNIWEITGATLDKTKIDVTKTYRIIMLLMATTDAGDCEFPNYFSFISESISGDSTVPVCAPIGCSRLTDYLGQVQDCMQVAPAERIKAQLFMAGGGYDLCAVTSLFDGLFKVEVSTYSYDNGTRHNYDFFSVNRTGTTTFNTANTPIEVTADAANGGFTVDYLFRVRYEDTPNLTSYFYDIVNDVAGISGPGTSTNNWLGREVFIEYRFFVQQGALTDELVYRQKIQVGQWDTTVMNISITDASGNSVYAICEGDPPVTICVDKNDGFDNDLFIPAIEGEPFSSSNLEEENPVAGNLPQLDTPKLFDADSNFAGTLACVKLETEELTTGKPYRFYAIKKKEADLGKCGEGDSISQIGNDELYREVELGTISGVVIIAYEMGGTWFDTSPNLRDKMLALYSCNFGPYYGYFPTKSYGGNQYEIYDGTDELIETTATPGASGFVEGGGYLVMDYRAYICCPTKLLVNVIPDPASSSTGYWFKVNCAGTTVDCGTVVENDNDIAEMVAYYLGDTPGWVVMDYAISGFNGATVGIYFDQKRVARTGPSGQVQSPMYVTGAGQLTFWYPGPDYHPDYAVVVYRKRVASDTVTVQMRCPSGAPYDCGLTMPLGTIEAAYYGYELPNAAGTYTVDYNITYFDGSGYYVHIELDGVILDSTTTFVGSNGSLSTGALPAGAKRIVVYVLKRYDGPTTYNSVNNEIEITVNC